MTNEEMARRICNERQWEIKTDDGRYILSAYRLYDLILTALDAAHRAGAAQERARCAKFAENLYDLHEAKHEYLAADSCKAIANAIRADGEAG